jgi:hypothetical protein
MSDILNKTIVLVLNRNWQAINLRTPQDAHRARHRRRQPKEVNQRKADRLPHEA